MAEDGQQLAFPPSRAARWIQALVDASYLMTGDDDFDHMAHAHELRQLITWLLGRQH